MKTPTRSTLQPKILHSLLRGISSPHWLALMMVAIGTPLILGQESANPNNPSTTVSLAFEGETIDQWHGFKRHRFPFDGDEAWVVEPKEPRSDRRFSWCMMFPDAFTERCAAPMLVSRGFYHVYLSVGNSFGAPKAVDKLHAFHQMLVARGLHPQTVLIGISRGGLYAHRFAATYPKYVSVIYNDAPVLDYQSWPGGKGKGKGSPNDWQELKRCYGFESDAQAAQYDQTPLKTLEVLAQHKIAIVSVVGDSDDVVPVQENTAPAAMRFTELGGVFDVIHKPGIGHHPHGLDDPTPIVEFIEKHTSKKTFPSSTPAEKQ